MVKNLDSGMVKTACKAGDCLQCQRPGQEDPLEKKMSTHFRFSMLENPMDRAWQVVVHGVARVIHNLVTELLGFIPCFCHFLAISMFC